MVPSPTCPFCAIAQSYPPFPIFSSSTSTPSPAFLHTSSSPPDSTPKTRAQVLFSSPDLIAFLDHAPISAGHVLLATRQHRVKISDVRVREGQVLGAWMGVLSRAIVGVVRDQVEGVQGQWGNEPDTGRREGKGISAEDVQSGEEEMRGGNGVFEGDWNVVQNNGPRAAQVVPHVHFHIIPRTEDVPELKARSWTIFGRGIRGELDDDEAADLVKRIKTRIGDEVRRVEKSEGQEALRGLGIGKDGSWFELEEGRGGWKI